MEKVYGAEERHDILIRFTKTKRAVLVFGYGEEDGQGYDYRHTFNPIPTQGEVLNLIINHVNSLTDAKILNGFVWNGINVWLSTENQFNFKAAYDVAVQTNGANLPIKFKLGESNGEPVYHIFNNMEEFTDFYTSAITFIMTALNEGWAEKDYATQWVKTLGISE